METQKMATYTITCSDGSVTTVVAIAYLSPYQLRDCVRGIVWNVEMRLIP